MFVSEPMWKFMFYNPMVFYKNNGNHENAEDNSDSHKQGA